MSQPKPDVLVIGGGIIGAACARYLLEKDCTVTLVDRGLFGKGCSHGNCGYVCPSHVLPLAAPGAVKGALKALFTRNSPFSIKPRLDPALWSWLFHFARRCNQQDMLEAGYAIQALLDSSRMLYDQLLAAESIDCEWTPRGLLFVFKTQAAFDHYAHTDGLMREHYDMGAARYDSEALAQLEPALLPGLAGGWHYPGDAHLRPDLLMQSLKKRLLNKGLRIVENCDVLGWQAGSGGATAAKTTQGDMPAEQFVVATGAWTPFLAKELGCSIPIQPGKGYSITMSRPGRCPEIPLIFEEHRVAVTPFRAGYRIGSTMEFAGYDSTLNPARLGLLTESAKLYLHEPLGGTVEEEWFGWRPMTYDSLPIIDRSPTLGNVWIAAGHNMLGLSMAPATGKLLAELITRSAPHLDITPYRVGRF